MLILPVNGKRPNLADVGEGVKEMAKFCGRPI